MLKLIVISGTADNENENYLISKTDCNDNDGARDDRSRDPRVRETWPDSLFAAARVLATIRTAILNMEATINHLDNHHAQSNSSTHMGREYYELSRGYVLASTIIAILFALFSYFKKSSKCTPLPWVNQPGPFDIFRMKAKYRFLMGARDMVLQGFADFPDSAGFRMVADGGEIVMLAPKYAAELKNDHRVDFVKLFLQVKSSIPEIRMRCARSDHRE